MSGFVLDAVTLTNGRVPLLDGVSGCIEAGLCTAIVGPSGAGKSTLLRVLNRLAEPNSGRVLLNGTPIADLDVLELRRRVTLVPQRPVMLTDVVADDLRVGKPDLSQTRAIDLLQKVGLPAEFFDKRTSELSGGEAQRVCLARSFAIEPEIMLLDEPTSALDGANASLVVTLARDHVSQGGTVVLVSHDLDVVRRCADWALVVDRGRVTSSGSINEIDYLEVK
jgi:putative ABC transport system ATP-binding protein